MMDESCYLRIYLKPLPKGDPHEPTMFAGFAVMPQEHKKQIMIVAPKNQFDSSGEYLWKSQMFTCATMDGRSNIGDFLRLTND